MVSRREFLKLSYLSAFSLLVSLFPGLNAKAEKPLPDSPEIAHLKGRITRNGVNLYIEPNFESERLGEFKRDQILTILEQVRSASGPDYNPRWYRLSSGYIHSGYVQRVDLAHTNPVNKEILRNGQLGEVTLPYIRSYLLTNSNRWKPVYRLYLGSIYWVTGLDTSPKGEIWYLLTDDLLHVTLGVPARAIRLINQDELLPISPNIPDGDKRIEISLSKQHLTCYEEDNVVMSTNVSTGLPTYGTPLNGIPTETPKGSWHIATKLPSRHMGDGKLTDNPNAYELPGVPWVSFFHVYGIGFHGTYWHDNFGRKMSHGCVNMRSQDAKWLYRWTKPTATHEDWSKKGKGTRVLIY
jgi:hypothetical protein